MSRKGRKCGPCNSRITAERCGTGPASRKSSSICLEVAFPSMYCRAEQTSLVEISEIHTARVRHLPYSILQILHAPCGSGFTREHGRSPCHSTLGLAQDSQRIAPVYTSRKKAGASVTAAALIAHGLAASPLVTIGVTNADVTSNSHVIDGAADQGMDCT